MFIDRTVDSCNVLTKVLANPRRAFAVYLVSENQTVPQRQALMNNDRLVLFTLTERGQIRKRLG